MVTEAHQAGAGGLHGELSVRVGQQVEIVDRPASNSDWFFVRVADGGDCREGLLPSGKLRILTPSADGSQTQRSETHPTAAGGNWSSLGEVSIWNTSPAETVQLLSCP